eukprot:848296-Pleurochrysis_carterae.AAC.2
MHCLRGRLTLKRRCESRSCRSRGEKAHAGRANLEKGWDGMTQDGRLKAMLRQTRGRAGQLEDAAVDWEPTAVATALDRLDLISDLLSIRPFVMARTEFAKELAKLLQAEGNVSLALYLKTELSISDSDCQRLRLAMSKEFDDR